MRKAKQSSKNTLIGIGIGLFTSIVGGIIIYFLFREDPYNYQKL